MRVLYEEILHWRYVLWRQNGYDLRIFRLGIGYYCCGFMRAAYRAQTHGKPDAKYRRTENELEKRSQRHRESRKRSEKNENPEQHQHTSARHAQYCIRGL